MKYSSMRSYSAGSDRTFVQTSCAWNHGLLADYDLVLGPDAVELSRKAYGGSRRVPHRTYCKEEGLGAAVNPPDEDCCTVLTPDAAGSRQSVTRYKMGISVPLVRKR